jgi:hypothetical protein
MNDMGGPHQCRGNEVVANMYAPTERTPPHHDFSPLYARAETIVSFNILAWRMRRPSKVDGETVAGFEDQLPLRLALA